MSKIKFNGKDAPGWLFLEEGFVLPSFNVKSQYEEHENMNGSRFIRRQMEPFEFALPLIIKNNQNPKTSDEIQEVLSEYFYTKNEAILEFSFSGKSLLCTVEGPFDLKPAVKDFEIVTLTVKTGQWYYERLGPPNKNTFEDGRLTAFNSGIETPPKQHFTISKNTTQLSVSNETTEESVSFGAERLPDEEAPQEDERVLNAFGNNIFYWPNIPSGQQLPVVGTAQGSYESADGVLWPATYGDRHGKLGWIGPAKQMQLQEPVEGDWEWECRVLTPRWTWRQMVRKQFMLLDVNRQPLALIEVRNQSSVNIRTTIIMSLYDGLNRRQIMYLDTAKFRQGLVLRMTKRGKHYECYYGIDLTISTGERFNPHTNVVRREWTDRAGDFERPAVFAHTQDLRLPNEQEAFVNTSYFKLLKFADNTDRTPFIFHAGDEVMIDHDKHLLSVNGDIKFYKQLRSDYWTLPKGENEIRVDPPDVIESGYQTFRERYL